MIVKKASSEIMVFNYHSRLADTLTQPDLDRLFQQAFVFNTLNGITGYLRIYNRHVFQSLEGRPDVITKVAARIISDRRHSEVSVFRLSLSQMRFSQDWKVIFPGQVADGGASPGAWAWAQDQDSTGRESIVGFPGSTS